MYVTEADDAWYSIDDANKLSQVEWGYSMSFNKDGNILASSAGKYIKIWTFNNGALSYEKNSHMIKAHSLDINVLKFSKSSNLLVSGSDDNYINIWQGIAGNKFQKIQSIQVNSWPIHALFSTDESFLFSGLWNGSLQIYLKAGNQYQNHQQIKSHQSQIYSVSLNNTESLLLTLGWDSVINIYQKDAFNKWQQNKQIQLMYKGFRACFIDDNQIVYQPKETATIELYQMNNVGNFDLKNVRFQIKDGNDDKSYFPIKYNKQLSLVAIKYNKFINIYEKKNDYTYDLKKNFQLDDDKFFGDITTDFKYVVVWIKSKNQYQVLKV